MIYQHRQRAPLIFNWIYQLLWKEKEATIERALYPGRLGSDRYAYRWNPAVARVLRAIELLRERLDAPVQQEEIADAVFLSPSRFRHVFVAETGMPFRCHVLWLRLERALQEMARGASLTRAAYAAGFADQAHMSRTFRRMFGVPPPVLRLEE